MEKLMDRANIQGKRWLLALKIIGGVTFSLFYTKREDMVHGLGDHDDENAATEER